VQKIRVFATAWLFLSLLLTALSGQELELTSDKPIEFDEANRQMIATGEAMLTYGDLILRADRIVYDEAASTAEATGNIRISQEGYRALAERVKVNTETLYLEAFQVRFGAHPIYAEADSAIGDEKRLELKNAKVYYLEPDRYSPELDVESLVVENGEILDGDKVKFKLLGLPVWYLPSLRIPTDIEPFSLEARAGSSGELGVYLQTEWLFPLNSKFFLGANLDAYTDRGFLYGPAMRYRVADNDAGTFTNAYLSTGFISDYGDKGFDIYGDNVEEHRWFINGSYQQRFDENQFLHASIHALSDSEMLRDFREGEFTNNQQPGSFVEYIYQGDNWSISGLLRPNFKQYDFPYSSFYSEMRNPNPVVERLPEIRAELYPIELGETGIYQSAWATAGFYRYDLPQYYWKDEASEYSKWEAYYGLEKPFALGNAFTGKIVAAGRVTHWEGLDRIALFSDYLGLWGAYWTEGLNETQYAGEVGFDLEGNFFKTWDIDKPVWKINGLKHVVKPFISYRWMPVEDELMETGFTEGLDTLALDTNRPDFSLATRRDSASITEQHYARIGFKNQLFTRHTDFGARELASLELSTDYYWEGPWVDDTSFIYTALQVHPADWIDLGVDARWSTDKLKINEWNTHFTIKDADRWYLRYTNTYADFSRGFGAYGDSVIDASTLYMLENAMWLNSWGSYDMGMAVHDYMTGTLDITVDQHLLEFGYRFNENFRMRALMRYDMRMDSFIEERISLYQQLGKLFELQYSLVYRDGAAREDDWSFNVGLNLLSF